ncbi:hypothetical protein [Halomarina pelagica]|nr:hypothetical protein [Halomarina sp. BND7]
MSFDEHRRRFAFFDGDPLGKFLFEISLGKRDRVLLAEVLYQVRR